MASATPNESADSELHCPVCLDTFVCPCTLSCGHSFCVRCLETAWETVNSFSCPQCRETFPVRPQLRRNVALSNLAEQLRVGDRMATITMCDEDQMCQEHRKEQLNFYCEQDGSLACTVCTIAGDHSGHKVIAVETAQQTKQEIICLEKTKREKNKEKVASWTQQLRGTYARTQESLRGTKERIRREFERRREQLREEEREALERVDEEGRSVLSRIQADIARYENRARDLDQEITELLSAINVQDPLSFLQHPMHEKLRSSVSEETQDDSGPVSCHLDLAKVISVGGIKTNLLAVLYGHAPTLDINSVNNDVQVSSDLRTVTWTNVSQARPHHPHRFDSWPQALCSESFSSGQHYWEVDVGGSGSWRVGVAYETTPRKGSSEACSLGGNKESWSLRKNNNRYSMRHGGGGTSLLVPEPPQRVGVHLDWDAGLLSFYSADSMALLHSFHQNFAQSIYPGLAVWGKDGNAVTIVDLSHVS
ncbi:zinc-binding protein A33-like [Lampetra fluviatilis]